MDASDVGVLEEVLARAETVAPAQVEKTIFSVGARGHFEKPVSELLAFFLDPDEEHGLGDLFLGALIQCAQDVGVLPDGIRFELAAPPTREMTTAAQNHIDLVLEGMDWVLAIENKVYAPLANPLSDYESHVATTYPRKTNRAYVVLGLSKTSPPSPWCFISYRSFLEGVKQRFGQSLLRNGGGKWLMLAREFLLHLEHLGGEGAMSDDAIEFVTANYQKIEKLMGLRASFIEHLKDNLRRIGSATGAEPWVGEQTWKAVDIRALRLGAANWGGSDIALMINSDGTASARVYLQLRRGEPPGPDERKREEDRADAHFRVERVVQSMNEGAKYRYYTFAARDTPTAALPDVETACKLLSEWDPQVG